MKKMISMVMMELATACVAFGEMSYEKGRVYGPIVELGDEARTIDGNGAIIDGGGTNRCATLGPNVTLKNFTFRNGKAAVGGGVWGGAVTNCTIRDCTASEYGAAVANCKVGSTAIAGCTRPLDGSVKAATHGGIAADSKLDGVTITGCRVEMGTTVPCFGGIAANSDLTGCTVTDNELVISGDHYGLLFYGGSLGNSTIQANTADSSLTNVVVYMKVTPVECALDGDKPLPPGPVPPGPTPEDPFDGTAANYYVVMLQDGSTLVISTAKQKVKGGVATSTLTAKLTVGKKTYSYTGGKITDGEMTELPICKTSGAPQFGELTLTRNEAVGVFGAAGIYGSRLKQEDFDAEFIDWRQHSALRVGVAFSATVNVSERCGPVKLSASKLPSGLKIDKATGEISGVPTKAKEYLTRITATSTVSSKLKAYTDFPIVIKALDDWAIGTFNGGGGDCQVKITISKTGKISGQLLTGGLKWTLSAKSFDDYAEGVYTAALTCKNGRTVRSCEITLSENGLVGVDETGREFMALRNCWKEYSWKTIAKAFARAKPVSFTPTGFKDESTITLKFSSSGAVTAKGQFVKSYNSRTGKPSFYSASCATALCPTEDPNEAGAFTGVVYIYYPPKKNTPIPNGYIDCVNVRWTGSAFELAK